MKKALVIISVVLIVLALGCAGTIIAFPQQAQTVINNIRNSIGNETATQPATEATAATQPPTQPPTPKLTLANSDTSIEVGAAIDLQAKETAGAANVNIRYDTSDKNIASVDATGKVTAMSMGTCDVWAYADGYNDTKQTVKITVTDARIDKINVLNDYLYSQPLTKDYTYATSKTGKARLTKCKITDFNSDGNYMLFIKYNMTDSMNKAEFVLESGGSTTPYKTADGYSNIANGGYTSYTEDIYLTADGTPCIIAESKKNKTAVLTETTTVLYTISGSNLAASETLTEISPKNVKDTKTKSEFKKDGKAITQDEYITALSVVKSGKTLQEKYVDTFADVNEGKNIKAAMPFDLGSAYGNRIKWKSSDEKIAKVNSGGVIIGSATGSCEITGTIDGMFSSALSRTSVTVTGVEDEYTAYVRAEKSKTITGDNGVNMGLYAYQTMDLDGDGKKELYMYYTGNSTAQIDRVVIANGKTDRTVVLNESTESGKVLSLEFYTNLSNKEIMLRENYEKSSSSTTEFYFDTYTDGSFVKASSVYRIESSSLNAKTKYYMGDEEVEESTFAGSVGRYQKTGEWTLIKD